MKDFKVKLIEGKEGNLLAIYTLVADSIESAKDIVGASINGRQFADISYKAGNAIATTRIYSSKSYRLFRLRDNFKAGILPIQEKQASLKLQGVG